MASLHAVVVVVVAAAAASLLLMAAFDGALVHADFYNDVDFVWGYQNAGIWNDGNSLSLMLDNVSGLHRPVVSELSYVGLHSILTLSCIHVQVAGW